MRVRVAYAAGKGADYPVMGGQRFDWGDKDMFTVPMWTFYEYVNNGDRPPERRFRPRARKPGYGPSSCPATYPHHHLLHPRRHFHACSRCSRERMARMRRRFGRWHPARARTRKSVASHLCELSTLLLIRSPRRHGQGSIVEL
jgi:hypothetical protein